MAPHSGSVDPGLVLRLVTDAGLEPQAVRDGLEQHAGLARGSDVMRDLVARRVAGDD